MTVEGRGALRMRRDLRHSWNNGACLLSNVAYVERKKKKVPEQQNPQYF